MKSMSNVIGAVASVALIGAGAALYVLTPPDLDPQFRTAITTIQRMQQLGAEWGVETARVRADPSANFDGLAEFVPRMKQMRSTLRENLAQIPGLSDRVAADARAYLSAMESLRERVERFKTAYAVIRNSERYLPLSSAELVARAQGAGDRELAREVSLLTQEFSAFLATSNEADRERLSARIQTLKDEGVRKTSVLASAIANFVAHAEVLLDKQGRTDELFQGITSNILSERVKPLTDSLELEQSERRGNTMLYRQGTIAVGVGVLLVWVVIGFTRRSPRKESRRGLRRTRRRTRRRADSSRRSRDGHRDRRAGARGRERLARRGGLAGRRCARFRSVPRTESPHRRRSDPGSADHRRNVRTHGPEHRRLHAQDERGPERHPQENGGSRGRRGGRGGRAAVETPARRHAPARFLRATHGRARQAPRAERSREHRRERVPGRGSERDRRRDVVHRRASLRGGPGNCGVEDGAGSSSSPPAPTMRCTRSGTWTARKRSWRSRPRRPTSM